MALLVVAMVVIGCATPVDSAASPGSAPASGVAPSAEPSASAPTGPFRPSPAPSPTFASYVVRRGDTLRALAARFATTAESLAYWNRARYPTLDPVSAGSAAAGATNTVAATPVATSHWSVASAPAAVDAPAPGPPP